MVDLKRFSEIYKWEYVQLDFDCVSIEVIVEVARMKFSMDIKLKLVRIKKHFFSKTLVCNINLK